MDNPTVLGGKTNVFGLLFFVLWTIALIAIVQLISPYPGTRRQTAIIAAGILLMIPDLIWRYRQPGGSLWRFASDIHGGAAIYVPAWVWMPMLSTIAAFFWLNENH